MASTGEFPNRWPKKKTEEEEAICLADNIVIISKISRELFVIWKGLQLNLLSN